MTDDLAFEGHWEQRGLVKIPVIPKDPYDIFDFGKGFTITSEPVTDRDHVPSHSGYNSHRRRGEEPCTECKAAERMYHHNRRNQCRTTS